jgi:hypothetical protein
MHYRQARLSNRCWRHRAFRDSDSRLTHLGQEVTHEAVIQVSRLGIKTYIRPSLQFLRNRRLAHSGKQMRTAERFFVPTYFIIASFVPILVHMMVRDINTRTFRAEAHSSSSPPKSSSSVGLWLDRQWEKLRFVDDLRN